jgi:hypothetical protein
LMVQTPCSKWFFRWPVPLGLMNVL